MLHDPPPDKRPPEVRSKYLGRIVRTRRNPPASQTIIRRLSQCSSTVQRDAAAAILPRRHFPVKSAETVIFATAMRLTGELPDVGADGDVPRNLIRDDGAASDCLQGAVIAVSVQCSDRHCLGNLAKVIWPREYWPRECWKDDPDRALETPAEPRRRAWRPSAGRSSWTGHPATGFPDNFLDVFPRLFSRPDRFRQRPGRGDARSMATGRSAATPLRAHKPSNAP